MHSGYDIYRHDRNKTNNQKKGGCAFLIKHGIGFKHTCTSDSKNPIEYQIGELFDANKNKINVVNIYNPCTILNDDSLKEILDVAISIAIIHSGVVLNLITMAKLLKILLLKTIWSALILVRAQ